MQHRRIVLVVAAALLICLAGATGLLSANAAPTVQAGTAGTEVYRFYDRLNGSHFYTADPSERDAVQQNLANVYTYEGTAYSFVTPAQMDAAIAAATIAGPQGAKGDTGAVGPKGDKGDPGITPAELVELRDAVDALTTKVESQEASITALRAELDVVKANSVLDLGDYVSVNPDSQNGVAGPNIVFTGANLHIRSGAGATDAAVNGKGNLIIGYDEMRGATEIGRTGSHNLVIGWGHKFTSYSGIVAGGLNTISAPYASVSGGYNNTASGPQSSVSGGYGNTASGSFASVSGGVANTASGSQSSVSGGLNGIASGGDSSVSGGYNNTASGSQSSVSGGNHSTAPGTYDWWGGSYHTP